MKKTEILMNKHVYLGLSILELTKILMYEFWYDYVKPKYGKKQNFIILLLLKFSFLQEMLKLDLILQIIN